MHVCLWEIRWGVLTSANSLYLAKPFPDEFVPWFESTACLRTCVCVCVCVTRWSGLNVAVWVVAVDFRSREFSSPNQNLEGNSPSRLPSSLSTILVKLFITSSPCYPVFLSSSVIHSLHTPPPPHPTSLSVLEALILSAMYTLCIRLTRECTDSAMSIFGWDGGWALRLEYEGPCKGIRRSDMIGA